MIKIHFCECSGASPDAIDKGKRRGDAIDEGKHRGHRRGFVILENV